jgi:hypothetical protein
MREIIGTKNVLLGVNKDGEHIYISKPTWDCGWYWSFGYLGNRNCHYHLEAYQSKDHHLKLADDAGYKYITEKRNKCMYDCLKADYALSPKIQENLWQFCELALTIYTLKEAAEVLGRGGSHMTTNLCKDILINPEETKRLNEKIIPELCQTFWNLIGGNG